VAGGLMAAMMASGWPIARAGFVTPLGAARAAALLAQFRDEPAYATVGLQLADLARGRCLTRTPIAQGLLHPRGAVQGGIAAMILDSTAGYTALTEIEGDQRDDDMATLEFKTSFLAPARGAATACLVETLRSGRRIVFSRAWLWVESESGDRELCAEATLAFTRLRARRDGPE